MIDSMHGTAATGYSGTPLGKKLGITRGCRILKIAAPPEYGELVAPLPEGVTFEGKAGPRIDLAHLFVTRQEDLVEQLAALRIRLRPEVPVWVSWPKKAARVPTTVTEDTIREAALPVGYVDVKVCAVSAVWSGLKLVVRKELR